MALEKRTIQFKFSGGLDTMEDPYQIPMGKFQALNNVQFIKPAEGGISSLNKRSGFGSLAQNIGTTSFLTTFNDNLVGYGRYVVAPIVNPNPSSFLFSYIDGPQKWVPSGAYTPVTLSVQPAVRNTYSQSFQDMAVAPNGMALVTYKTSDITSTNQWRYAILDVNTGQNVITPTTLTPSIGSVFFQPRVYYFNDKFVIAYGIHNGANTTASSYFLELKSIPTGSPTSAGSTTIISSSTQMYYLAGGFNYGPPFDATVSSGNMFFAWGESSTGIRAATISNTMTRTNIGLISSSIANQIAVTSDQTVGSNSTIYVGGIIGSNASGLEVSFVAVDSNLAQKSSGSAAQANTLPVSNVTISAQSGQAQIFAEVERVYSHSPTIKTNSISVWPVSSSGGSIGAEVTLLRGVGLTSKAFVVNSFTAMLVSYKSAGYQDTYFLVNNSGNVLAKLAYGNGIGYTQGPVGVSVYGSQYMIPYLYRATITPVSRETLVGSNSGGFFSTTGINMVGFNFQDSNVPNKEMGNALNLGGGFLWSYDGLRATEQNFFLFPDNQLIVVGSVGGNLSPQTYYYRNTYEYIDNQGNRYVSFPGLPYPVTNGSGNSVNTIYMPTMRLTYKGSPNFLTYNVYRWSVNQQTYYRLTPPNVQTAALSAQDSVPIIDTFSDAQIIGNEILYTNGGEVENSNAPATNCITTFDDRLWMISAEDPNTLWYSKTILPGTPVEMSDLLTYFVPPNTGTSAPTGPMKAIAPMDDKLVIFKRNAIYYINGTGPDSLGNNSQYSQPIFVNGTIGCIAVNSLVLVPNGLMFQSDNGIWMLQRDLGLNFIGKDVEAYNNSLVTSSVYVPGTSEVRFTLNTGEVLVYDYLVNQWSVNNTVPALSSTIYKKKHTYVNDSNSLFQETLGLYSDGSTPTTFSFTTGWLNFADLQGYARLYEIYLLGKFLSPHQLQVGIAYDYNPTILQTAIINPPNVVGSGSAVEQWQINPIRQSCQAVQLTVTEVASQSAGAGVSISGLNMVVGLKKSYPNNIPPNKRTS